MKNTEFIDQFDPTTPLDLGSVTLQTQYTKLTKQEKLLVFCKINGYNRIPPTIEQLYSDPYYLGGARFFDGGSNLFDYWKKALPKIFPSQVTTAFPYLILSGAIGIGKSTISRLCLANTYARLLCMENPSKTLRLTPKPLSCVVFHRSEESAIKEFKYWFMREVLEYSPFFKTIHNPNLKFNVITSGPRGTGGLGSDVILYIIGEVNFWDNQENAQSRVSQALGRFTSRFDRKAVTKVGNFIIDSSAKGDSSVTEWFLDNTPPDLTWNCKPSHWEVKKDSYPSNKFFSVYAGDGKYPPQILPGDYKLSMDQDPGRVVKVPMELYGEAKIDLIKMLQDKAGISTGSSDLFFQGSIEHLINCTHGLKNPIPEKIVVDFYDRSDRLIDKLRPAVSLIPRGSTVWIGLDLAVVDNYTGLSAVTFDGWEQVNRSTRVPKIKSYFSVAIGRKEGQQTSLFHIFDFILALKSEGINVIVSADQAFSRQIIQDCEREGIQTHDISTDRVPSEPSLYLKNIIMQEQITLPPNRRLFREAYDLRYVAMQRGLKVDHPKKPTIDDKILDGADHPSVGSKDVWDSLSSAVYSLKMSIDAGEEDGFSNGINKQMELVKEMTESASDSTRDVFQGMLESFC